MSYFIGCTAFVRQDAMFFLYPSMDVSSEHGRLERVGSMITGSIDFSFPLGEPLSSSETEGCENHDCAA